MFPVKCHSGSHYAERPLSFAWEGGSYEVKVILAQWRSPEGRFFRVRTSDQHLFELRYDEIHDLWEIRPL
ncbi:MAG: hypothetical protein WHS87_01930 [Anaerolineales bacterium]